MMVFKMMVSLLNTIAHYFFILLVENAFLHLTLEEEDYTIFLS